MFARAPKWQFDLDRAFAQGQSEFIERWKQKCVVTVGFQVGNITVGNHERATFKVNTPDINPEAFEKLRNKAMMAAHDKKKRPVVIAFNCEATPDLFIISVTVDLLNLEQEV